MCVFIGKYGAIKTFFLYVFHEGKKAPKNPRQIDSVLDSAVAEAAVVVAIQLDGIRLCECEFVSLFVIEIGNRQGSFNCVDCLIVMETVEEDLTLLVSNFMCGLFKSVCKMENNSQEIVQIMVSFSSLLFSGWQWHLFI